METGEYFLKPEEKQTRELAKKKEAQVMASHKKRQEREKEFIPPEEAVPKDKSHDETPTMSIEDLKKKFQRDTLKRKEHQTIARESIEDYIETGGTKNKSKKS
jgi:ribosomal RNA assembly protein